VKAAQADDLPPSAIEMKVAATAKRPMILANENILIDASDALIDGMKVIGWFCTQLRLSKECWMLEGVVVRSRVMV
jgi:hypothetical protein